MNVSDNDDLIRGAGDASRLRRRGALHRTSHPSRQHASYVVLTCGRKLPACFQFTTHAQDPSPLPVPSSSTSSGFTLTPTSTGCGAPLTTRAYYNPAHPLYSSSSYVQSNIGVLEQYYLSAEQKSVAERLMRTAWGKFEWMALGCKKWCAHILPSRKVCMYLLLVVVILWGSNTHPPEDHTRRKTFGSRGSRTR